MKKSRMDRINKILIAVDLAAITLFSVITSSIVILNNKTPYYHSTSSILSTMMSTYGAISRLGIRALFSQLEYWCIFTYFAIPFVGIFGLSANSLTLTNALVTVILVLSIYGIGKKLHSPAAGVLASVILVSFPHIFGLARAIAMRYHTLGWVTAAVFALLSSEGFRKRGYSVLFGIIISICAMIKTDFLLFLFGPALISLLPLRQDLEKKAGNMILACLAFITPMVFTGGIVFSNLRDNIYSMVTPDRQISLFNDVFFYLRNHISFQLLLFFSVLFFISFISQAIRRKYLLVHSWYLVPLFFFSLMNTYKNVTFMVPALPAIALIISFFISDLKSAKMRLALEILTVLVGISTVLIISFVPTSYILIEKTNNAFGLAQACDYPLCERFFYWNKPYGTDPIETQFSGILYSGRYDWGLSEVLLALNRTGPADNLYVAVYDLNDRHIIKDPLQYYLVSAGFQNLSLPPIEDYVWPYFMGMNRSELALYSLEAADYFIITSSPAYPGISEVAYDVIKSDKMLVREISLPDGKSLFVYENAN